MPQCRKCLGFSMSSPVSCERCSKLAVLGLTASASWDEVRRAHKRMARRYHPDTVATADRARFDEVQEAFRFFEDVTANRQHPDRYDPPPARPVAPEPPFNDVPIPGGQSFSDAWDEANRTAQQGRSDPFYEEATAGGIDQQGLPAHDEASKPPRYDPPAAPVHYDIPENPAERLYQEARGHVRDRPSPITVSKPRRPVLAPLLRIVVILAVLVGAGWEIKRYYFPSLPAPPDPAHDPHLRELIREREARVAGYDRQHQRKPKHHKSHVY